MSDSSSLRLVHDLLSTQVELLRTCIDQVKQLEQTNANLQATVQQQTQTLEQRDRQLNKMVGESLRIWRHLTQMEKMAMLGQMIAGIAHEINNPITFIYGNLPYVEEHVEDLLTVLAAYQTNCPSSSPAIQDALASVELDFVLEDLPRIMGSIKVGADRIRELVLTLRNFYRLDEAEMKPADLHEGIESTLLLLNHRYKQDIEIVKAFGEIPEVECHINQLNQVFMNLLSNAIDALLEESPDQETDAEAIAAAPKKQVTICTQLVDPERVAISIADNGPGIAEAIQVRMFEPFFTTKPIGVGTGLGLAISHQIITENHHGTLSCCSTPNNGTTFKIELPVRQTNDATGESSTSNTEVSE